MRTQTGPAQRLSLIIALVTLAFIGSTSVRAETVPPPTSQRIAQAAKPAPARDRAPVERANAYLNALTSLSADFSQVTSDGRRFTGRLYVQRPGKLRFEYDPPTPLEIVSDGSTVLVRDRKLNTSDPYPISQTPLKFLTSSAIDLGREFTITDTAAEADSTRITFEDRTTLGGTSKITLTFDKDGTLSRWRIIDPQGANTTVTLSDVERNPKIDPKTFNFNFMRKVD